MSYKINQLATICTDPDTYNIPAIGCVKKIYTYGAVIGVGLLYLLTKR